jgi:proline iminopeptidase
MGRIIALFLFLLTAAPTAATPAREGYITTEDGVRLFYHVVGDGETKLVVVHGGPGNSLMSIEPDFTRFAELYTVIYYDQRGNGRSDLISDGAQLGIDQHIADLEAVRRHFGIERMNLFGNSWGGLLVAAYASAHPERVERLILHSPAPPTFGQMMEMSESMTNRFRRRYSPEEMSRLSEAFDPERHAAAENPLAMCQDWARMVLSVMAVDQEALTRFRGDLCAGGDAAIRQQQIVNRHVWNSLGQFDLRKRARSVTAQTLVIHGEGDNIPLAGSRDWAAAMPNARLLVIEGAGHTSHVERPDVFFPAVERFVAGEWPDGSRPVR